MDLLSKIKTVLECCNNAIEQGRADAGAFLAVRNVIKHIVEEEYGELDRMANLLQQGA